MSAHYTKPGLPPFPATTTSTMSSEDYAKACYDAGRADHIAEVGPMETLTYEQIKEIAVRCGMSNHFDKVLFVVRATENAHGIARPKEAL